MRVTCLHTVLLVLARHALWKEHTEYLCCASVLGRKENLTKLGDFSRIGFPGFPEAEEQVKVPPQGGL